MASAFWYGQAIMLAFGSGTESNAPNIDYLTDNIRLMLTTSSYVPNQDTHDFYNDVTNEVSGTGYTANGEALTSKTLDYTSGTNVIKFDAADVTWSAATFTARIGVLYNRTPATDATRPLISYIDFVSDQSPNASNFTVQWHANGVLTITPA
jgi:hypothetical protein